MGWDLAGTINKGLNAVFGKKEGESKDAKAARDRLGELSQQYEQAVSNYKTKIADYDKQIQQYQGKVDEFSNLVNENSGIKGYQKSLDMAQDQAGRMTSSQSQAAANQAIQAGRAAGGSKAAAAMNAMNAAGNTYATQYGQNLTAQQNQAASQLQNQIQLLFSLTNFAKRLVLCMVILRLQQVVEHLNSILQSVLT